MFISGINKKRGVIKYSKLSPRTIIDSEGSAAAGGFVPVETVQLNGTDAVAEIEVPDLGGLAGSARIES